MISDKKDNVFRIKLAEVTVEVHSRYPNVKEMCQEYLSEDKSDVVIVMTEEDIDNERKRYPDGDKAMAGYMETLAVYRKIAEAFLEHEILLIHGSAVAVDGSGYLFLAPSGTGKSTHTSLWREYLGDRAEMINDDKPLLRLEEDQVLVCGTPWNGKHRLGMNKNVPLKGLCVLRRGGANKIRRVSAKEAYADVFRQIYRPIADREKMEKTLELMDKILQLPMYHMECTISVEAAKMSYEEMHKVSDETVVVSTGMQSIPF